MYIKALKANLVENSDKSQNNMNISCFTVEMEFLEENRGYVCVYERLWSQKRISARF